MQYVLLLRGVNVGGKMVKMDSLKKMLEDMGLSGVKTLLNSGNVIFESEQTSVEHLRQTIEVRLEKEFGFIIQTIIRTIDDIQKLVKSNPFKGVSVTKNTRLYITFLSEKSDSLLKAPYLSQENDLHILRITDHEICTVVTVSKNKNTTNMMGFFEAEFGKKITTRSWNTVLKLVR